MVNKVILIGNLGADPDIRNTQQGNKVANFSLATKETWKDQSGQKQERTEWHKVVVFGDGAVKTIEQYVKKGDKLYVEGQLRTRKWQNQQGQDQYATEVVISGFNGCFNMLTPKQKQQNNGYGGQQQQQQQPTNQTDTLDDDIPF